MFKYLNTPSKGRGHTDFTFVTDRQISHLSQTDRFHIYDSTEALTDTAFYSLGLTIVLYLVLLESIKDLYYLLYTRLV